MKSLFFSLLLLLALAGPAWGTTYYVCEGGDGSDPDSGVCAEAWDADNFDDATLSAGDTVYIMDEGGIITHSGVDQAQMFYINEASGESGNPITFTAYPGDSPVIDLEGDDDRGFYVVNQNYIDIIGIEFRNLSPSDGATFVQHRSTDGADGHINVRECTFRQTTPTDGENQSCIRFEWINYFEVTDSSFVGPICGIRMKAGDADNDPEYPCGYGLIDRNTADGTGGDDNSHRFVFGESFGNDGDGDSGVVHDITVTDNNISNYYGQGVYHYIPNTKTGSGQFSYNWFVNDNILTDIGAMAIDLVGLYDNAEAYSRSTVNRNTITNAGCSGYGAAGNVVNGINIHHCDSMDVKYNTVDTVCTGGDSDGWGIILDYDKADDGYESTDIVVEGNTVKNCNDANTESPGGIWFFNTQNSVVKNNLIENCRIGIAHYDIHSTGNSLLNNTIVNCPIGLWNNAATALTVTNNIFANVDCGFLASTDQTQSTETYNDIYLDQSDTVVLRFDSGGNNGAAVDRWVAGETVSENGGDASGVVAGWLIDTGDWDDGDAGGYLVVYNSSGTWTEDINIDGSSGGANMATVADMIDTSTEYVDGDGDAWAAGTGTITADPIFVNAGGSNWWDWMPLEKLVYNGGTPISGITTGGDGFPHVGTTPIGAVDFSMIKYLLHRE